MHLSKGPSQPPYFGHDRESYDDFVSAPVAPVDLDTADARNRTSSAGPKDLISFCLWLWASTMGFVLGH